MTSEDGPSAPVEPPAETRERDGWDSGSLRSPLGKSATLMLAFLALLWLVDLLNAANDRSWNERFGIVAREPDHLLGILISPFLHSNATHLVANASALFTLGLVAGLYGVWRYLGVVAMIILLGGAADWLIGPAGTPAIGASGIVFGLFGYLASRGLFDRRPVDIVISLGVAIAFGYHIVAGLLPGDERIAWWGHLAGFLAGVIAAWVFRHRKREKSMVPRPSDAAPDGATVTSTRPAIPAQGDGPDRD